MICLHSWICYDGNCVGKGQLLVQSVHFESVCREYNRTTQPRSSSLTREWIHYWINAFSLQRLKICTYFHPLTRCLPSLFKVLTARNFNYVVNGPSYREIVCSVNSSIGRIPAVHRFLSKRKYEILTKIEISKDFKRIFTNRLLVNWQEIIQNHSLQGKAWGQDIERETNRYKGRSL